jgi:hypothetical protein
MPPTRACSERMKVFKLSRKSWALPTYATQKYANLVKNACFFYRGFGKSKPTYDKNQNILFSAHGANTGSEV